MLKTGGGGRKITAPIVLLSLPSSWEELATPWIGAVHLHWIPVNPSNQERGVWTKYTSFSHNDILHWKLTKPYQNDGVSTIVWWEYCFEILCLPLDLKSSLIYEGWANIGTPCKRRDTFIETPRGLLGARLILLCGFCLWFTLWRWWKCYCCCIGYLVGWDLSNASHLLILDKIMNLVYVFVTKLVTKNTLMIFFVNIGIFLGHLWFVFRCDSGQRTGYLIFLR